MELIDFTHSKCDPCLFLKGDITCMVYIDDCLFFGCNGNVLNKAIRDLKDAQMDLNIEDDIAGYVNVVEMKIYLAYNSRPESAFLVHQCTGHIHNPTALRAKYSKKICRYL